MSAYEDGREAFRTSYRGSNPYKGDYDPFTADEWRAGYEGAFRDCMREGWNACREHRPIASNPHPVESLARKAWAKGYRKC